MLLGNPGDGNGELKGIEAATHLFTGQVWRVCIARAFLLDTRILLLDEPTEARVLDALGKLMEGKTTLLVSHRPRALAFVGSMVRVE
ncbi:ATP-binding cassette domain-containing protein [Salinicola sp. CR57]|uniref:ATP-binding cassette domain-containing protein n=1 Tax=Salinicola sp. CR57 TaxID=1949086 RepID=UPI000DA1C7B7|nr:ATP-binding cassette domain-containing protein [Salinicola sp. CR57]